MFGAFQQPVQPAESGKERKVWIYACSNCDRRYKAYRPSAGHQFCSDLCKQRFYRRQARFVKRTRPLKGIAILALAGGAVFFILRTMARAAR